MRDQYAARRPSLRFGANDAGSVMIEENVVFAAATTYRATEAELRSMLTAANFISLLRTMPFIGKRPA